LDFPDVKFLKYILRLVLSLSFALATAGRFRVLHCHERLTLYITRDVGTCLVDQAMMTEVRGACTSTVSVDFVLFFIF
jgi:hypothetical protein